MAAAATVPEKPKQKSTGNVNSSTKASKKGKSGFVEKLDVQRSPRRISKTNEALNSAKSPRGPLDDTHPSQTSPQKKGPRRLVTQLNKASLIETNERKSERGRRTTGVWTSAEIKPLPPLPLSDGPIDVIEFPKSTIRECGGLDEPVRRLGGSPKKSKKTLTRIDYKTDVSANPRRNAIGFLDGGMDKADILREQPLSRTPSGSLDDFDLPLRLGRPQPPGAEKKVRGTTKKRANKKSASRKNTPNLSESEHTLQNIGNMSEPFLPSLVAETSFSPQLLSRNPSGSFDDFDLPATQSDDLRGGKTTDRAVSKRKNKKKTTASINTDDKMITTSSNHNESNSELLASSAAETRSRPSLSRNRSGSVDDFDLPMPLSRGHKVQQRAWDNAILAATPPPNMSTSDRRKLHFEKEKIKKVKKVIPLLEDDEEMNGSDSARGGMNLRPRARRRVVRRSNSFDEKDRLNVPFGRKCRIGGSVSKPGAPGKVRGSADNKSNDKNNVGFWMLAGATADLKPAIPNRRGSLDDMDLLPGRATPFEERYVVQQQILKQLTKKKKKMKRAKVTYKNREREKNIFSSMPDLDFSERSEVIRKSSEMMQGSSTVGKFNNKTFFESTSSFGDIETSHSSLTEHSSLVEVPSQWSSLSEPVLKLDTADSTNIFKQHDEPQTPVWKTKKRKGVRGGGREDETLQFSLKGASLPVESSETLTSGTPQHPFSSPDEFRVKPLTRGSSLGSVFTNPTSVSRSITRESTILQDQNGHTAQQKQFLSPYKTTSKSYVRTVSMDDIKPPVLADTSSLQPTFAKEQNHVCFNRSLSVNKIDTMQFPLAASFGNETVTTPAFVRHQQHSSTLKSRTKAFARSISDGRICTSDSFDTDRSHIAATSMSGTNKSGTEVVSRCGLPGGTEVVGRTKKTIMVRGKGLDEETHTRRRRRQQEASHQTRNRPVQFFRSQRVTLKDSDPQMNLSGHDSRAIGALPTPTRAETIDDAKLRGNETLGFENTYALSPHFANWQGPTIQS